MKPTQATLALTLGLAALTPPAFAQPAPAAAPVAGSGLLGKRSAEAGAMISDNTNDSDDGYTAGATVNIPVRSFLDVGATFEHSWLEGDQGENFQDLSAFATAYTQRGAFRPFARAELGYEWWHVSNDAFYQLDAGTEYLLNDRLSHSAQISWGEYLAEDWNGGGFSASTRANYWVTKSLAASGIIGYTEGGNWNYGLAAVFSF